QGAHLTADGRRVELHRRSEIGKPHRPLLDQLAEQNETGLVATAVHPHAAQPVSASDDVVERLDQRAGRELSCLHHTTIGAISPELKLILKSGQCAEPRPACRARRIASARSFTCSFVKTLET